MINFEEKIQLQFLVNGEILLDEERAKLLLLIKKLGSILSAAKSLSIPYTRAWEHIMKMERIAGTRILEVKRGGRGGGGAKLTSEGLKLLNMYLRSYKNVFNRDLGIPEKLEFEKVTHIYAGSDDILLKHIFNILRKKGYRLESYIIGSIKGLASILLDEAELAGIHLLDPDTGRYNTSYIKRYSAGVDLILIRGYKRLQGFVTREKFEYTDIIDGLLNGKLRFVNRNPGSGTRILVDHIFNQILKDRGIEAKPENIIIGYRESVNTHLEVASTVAEGKADVGICIAPCAEYFNLNFIPVKWENFDFIIRSEDLEKPIIRKFIEVLKSEEVKNYVSSLSGYELHEDTGNVIKI